MSHHVQEKDWTNDFSKHPLPALYSIDLESNQQLQITKPPKGYSDYSPQYVKSIGKLVWFRGTSIIDRDKDLWKANPDGTGAEKWIEKVEVIEFLKNANRNEPPRNLLSSWFFLLVKGH
ncbi:hypothetical protein [Bacillus litorisediminis]|uniref:hypothetical protein n=1 Tax=Bacillus litorisediminis TaxID=2922713 RepID=UPI001FAD4AAD|nr:hypothetical protein [Bacillus litorisediminis]